MTISMTSKLSANSVSRRSLILSGLALGAMPAPAFALSTAQARALVQSAVDEINLVINSGRSLSRMFDDFEKIFAKYADLPTISATVLGPPARVAPASEMRKFSNAFRRYMSVKYGKRFKELEGGKIEVKNAAKRKSRFIVETVTVLAGTAPFSVAFVITSEGKILDMVIEGISLLKTEAVEVRAIYDSNGRDLGRTTKVLANFS